MDLSIPLIFLAIFIVACLSLFLVYKMGIKEKSYEEALAEQRLQTNALLGVKQHKPKEKKSKKAAKKIKDKTSNTTEETDVTTDLEKDQQNNIETILSQSSSHKLHVEFKEQPEEVVPIAEDVPIKEIVKPKKIKKVRPILVKKDQQKHATNVKLDIVDTPIINHFEDNPPKDDFELLRSNSKDDLIKHQSDSLKEKPISNIKEKKQQESAAVAPTNNSKTQKKHGKQQQSAQISTTTTTLPAAAVVETSAAVASTPATETEETPLMDVKSAVVETITAPQFNGSSSVLSNVGKEKKKKKSEYNARQQMTAERDGIINTVRNADLSKTDVQILIDLLLNKQLEAPDKLDEWTEGKSDPVQKLKKQLSEKEKLLAEEQEALVGAQAKLREIRAEQQNEKVQFQQKIRGLEEALQLKQSELNTTAAHQQAANQKIQQLQAQLTNEIARTRKMADEMSVLQRQTQQYEISLTQVQETEAMLAKKRSDVEQLSAENQALHVELQQIIADKDNQHQHFLMQMSNLEKNLEQQLELNRQLKETQQDLERNLEMALRQENEWKIEISKLNTALQQEKEEKRKMEHRIDQLSEELRQARNEKPELNKTISMLKSELNQLQEQNTHQNGNREDTTKAYEVEILNLTNELTSVKTEMQQQEKHFKLELDNLGKNYSKLQNELEEQKAKNNDLRTKNWKVMEALNAAETKCKNALDKKKTDIDVNKLTSDIIEKQQSSQKQFILRLFPDIQELKTVLTADDWQDRVSTLISNYMNILKKNHQSTETTTTSTSTTPLQVTSNSDEVTKLEAEVLHYKRVINETEGILYKLQDEVHSQEISWRKQIANKEAQIETLRKQVDKLSLLENEVTSLQNHLEEAQTVNQRLANEMEHSKRQHQNPQADATATIEKLTEEVNRLQDQLIRSEQTNKNGDLKVCLKAQNNCNNSTNGPAFIEGNSN